MTTTPSSTVEELSLKNFHPESTPTTPPTTPPIMLPRPLPLEEVVWFAWEDELLKPKDSSTRRGQAERTIPVFPSKSRWQIVASFCQTTCSA